ncbi:MAG TPA: acyltransferase [Nonomuraea sp.]|uniref:acyltransferase family protein n=1 Tax=Nonomuraea sp. NPDC049649 TaxID=3155776 RepID=UPI002BDC420F|nr:acyltransferase [Nonomuraea sp.]
MATDIVGGSGAGTRERDPGPSIRTKREYFPELQGIRAIAVLAVITVHSAFTAGWLGHSGNPGNGFYAVLIERFTRESLPILFALSGFLLYRRFALVTIAGAAKPDLKAYAWRRVLRIFPAYWLQVVGVLVLLSSGHITGFWQVFRVMTMQHVYVAGDIVPGLESTWSMATEIAFYVTLPIMAWIGHRMAARTADPVAKARRLLVGIFAIILIGYAYSAYSHLPELGPYPLQGNWAPGWFGYLAVGMGLAVLSVAAEVAPDRLIRPYRLIAKYPGATWFAALVVILLFCFSPAGGQGTVDYPPTSVVLFDQPVDLTIVFLLLAPLTVPGVRSKVIASVLNFRPLQFIGRVSYGMFLWHIPFIYFWNGSMFGAESYLEILLKVQISSFLMAVVSYYLVEKPALTLRNRLGKVSAEPSMPVLVR